ncbi:endonuclease/exonuclease/phosphatase family protein [Porphyromonas sp. oral taxon 278 str. W7784]|uniref:endonuclease/exonuclease/phosphatase family protein n=1 Tax=Porphyromonas sp. oral taxon 278 TaxID=712437 RepID=UPI0003AD36C9|nr:endonuclease/exonuclease/phosphatase family protein [Porphyromonas sp. oral taxon 278]ERJ72443.1 endonuclease/exonuclease/phosphatase family protein [Porphyromonas sp. oral taxon 278 str. W7784]
MKLRALFTISSRIARILLLVGTLLVSGAYLLGAYSGYIPPVRWIIPAFLGLFFPALLVAQIGVTIFWLLAWDKRRLLLVAAVWLISLPQLLVYFPISRAEKSLGTEEESLRILSYNVCAFGFKPHTKTSPNATLQYIKSSGADIVCIQEAMLNQNPWAGVVSKTLRSYLDEDYPYINVIRVNRGGSTLALLSKYPIKEAKEIPLPSWVNGAVAYKVDIRGKETLVINVHLESFRLRRVDGEDYLRLAKDGDAIRLKDALRAKLSPTFRSHNIQANIIHDLIQSHGSGRVIVCGDFNDTPLSYARYKIGEGLEDAFVSKGNGLGISFHTRPFFVRIDHILFGPAFRALRCEVDKTASESDHYPIEAVLTTSGVTDPN